MDFKVGVHNEHSSTTSSPDSDLYPLWTTVQEQSRGLLSSAESAYTEGEQSRGSSEAGDIVLCMPGSVKENKNPIKREGSKTMAELQADFVKLRKRFKAQAGSKQVVEKQCKALQELCAKQRLHMDALTDDASQSGRLSATVFKLELELKSLKSSQGAKPLQHTQTMHSASDENTAAQLAALIRKAAAAQEAADSAQQQLSQAMQAHAEQMAGAQAAVESAQEDLRHTSQSLTQLQQELAAARQGHVDQVAVLQQQHAEHLAALKTGYSETLAVSETELSEAKSSLVSTREQHAESLAELQKRSDSQLAAAESKHAVMLAASHAELAAARQHNIQQWLDLNQYYKNKQAQPLHSSPPHQAEPQHLAAVAQTFMQLPSAVAKHPSAVAKHPSAVAKHPSAVTKLSPAVAQAYLQPPPAVAMHLSDEAPFQTLATSSSLQAVTLKQHSSQAAADTADAEAQDVTAEESEFTALRQRLTALEKQLSLAQAEMLVHASTSVGRFELVCRMKAAAQGSKQCWTAKDSVQQMQQLMQSVAGAVRKQKQADHKTAVIGVQSIQQQAVTSVSRSKEEHGFADNYPSDEDDLDDWTQEGADDESDTDCAKDTDSTNSAAGDIQSTWTISARVTDCVSSSSVSSSSFPKSGVQKVPDAASSEAEIADTSAPEHARQGSCAEVQISSSAQMSSRSFPAANVTVFTTAVDPDVINSHPPEQSFGAQVMPAANPGISSVSDNAGCAEGDHSCEATSAGVADTHSSLATQMHPSEENDLDDLTCDDDDAYAHGGCSCAVTSGSVSKARSSSVFSDYPSDEDDLDDWTQEDDDTLFE